jgi:hypothetical protein
VGKRIKEILIRTKQVTMDTESTLKEALIILNDLKHTTLRLSSGNTAHRRANILTGIGLLELTLTELLNQKINNNETTKHI